MNPQHLETGVAVAEHGDFTRSAEALDVSLPSLSQAIAGIENQTETPRN